MTMHSHSSVVAFPVAPPADVSAIIAVNETPSPAPDVDAPEVEDAADVPPTIFQPATGMVDRKSLAAAAKLAGAVIERTNTIPVLSNCYLHNDAGGMILTATDLDIELAVRVTGSADAHFATTLPNKMLADIADKSEADNVRIAYEDAECAALTLGSTNLSLTTLPASDFPDMSAGSSTHIFELAANVLCNALKRVALAISTEETRYYLNGVYMHHFPANGVQRYNGLHGTLRFVATDGHRLAQFDVPAPEGCDGMPGVIIPRKTVKVILKAFGAKPRKPKKGEPAESTRMVAVDLSSTRVTFESGATRLRSKVIDGTFPDYGRVVPLGNDKRLTVNADEFAALLARVATVSGERGRAVRYSVDGERLTLSCSSPDHGTAVESIGCDWSGDPMDIGFNSDYALAILEQFSGERVSLMLADPGSPTLIHALNRDDRLYVLMPMRV